ncbi:MAG: serine hydrolase [Lachnospiraceae bacterium]|nr:serine hydrolase [Lachnospiraceae bacterium]
MKKRVSYKKIVAVLIAAVWLLTGCTEAVETIYATGTDKEDKEEDRSGQDVDKEESGQKKEMLSLESVEAVPEGEWQTEAVFPDRRGKVDDTLALNSIAGFDGYSGQGKMYISVSDNVESFDLFINDRKADTSGINPGGVYELDFSDAAKNGRNTVMVSSIEPLDMTEAVKINIPYPEVREGTPEEAGIRQEALDAVSDIISSDIEHGFTSAQLAVIRNGILVYENSWGKVNSYSPEGERITDSKDVTNDTLYDLASVTKMFSVNYSLQKLVTDGKIDLDSKVIIFLVNERDREF